MVSNYYSLEKVAIGLVAAVVIGLASRAWAADSGKESPLLSRVSLDRSGYELEGVLELKKFGGQLRIFGGGDGMKGESKREFKVYVKDCQWLIEILERDQNGKPLQLREYGTTNGGEIFELVTHLQPIKRAVQKGKGVSTEAEFVMPSASATISSNSAPVNSVDNPTVGNLWLMFASRCHLRGLTTNRLTPVYDLTASPLMKPELKLSAEWELIDGKAGFPSKVVFFNEGGLFRPTSQTNLTPRFVEYPSPYDKGFTNAIYATTGLTNIGGVIFSTGFVFEEFAPGGRKSRDDLIVTKRAEVRLTAIRPNCSRTSFLPTIQRQTAVTDRRLVNATPPTPAFGYTLSGSSGWTSAAGGQQINRQIKEKPKRLRNTLVLVIVVVFAPLTVYAFRRRMKSE